MTTVRGWRGLGQLLLRGGSGWLCFAVLAGIWLPEPLDVVASALFGLFFSSWLHEAGHVAIYQAAVGSGDPVVVRHRLGLATSVSVPRPEESSRMVALGGPLPTGVVGLVICLLASVTVTRSLWGLGAALLLHLAGLLPGSADGNRIWGLHEA